MADVTTVELQTALDVLTDEVDKRMKDLHGGDGPVSREVVVAQVLRRHPSLHDRILRTAADDPVHKRLGRMGTKVAVDKAVAAVSRSLAPDYPRMGMALAERHFPRLMKRWRGLPAD